MVQIGSGVLADPGGGNKFTCAASAHGWPSNVNLELASAVPKSVVIDAELLYIEVLARVALPCDSGPIKLDRDGRCDQNFDEKIPQERKNKFW